jgi:hypothetical protein
MSYLNGLAGLPPKLASTVILEHIETVGYRGLRVDMIGICFPVNFTRPLYQAVALSPKIVLKSEISFIIFSYDYELKMRYSSSAVKNTPKQEKSEISRL